MSYLHTETAAIHGAAGPPQVLVAARSNERPPPQPASHNFCNPAVNGIQYQTKYGAPSSGASNRRTSSTQQLLDQQSYQHQQQQASFHHQPQISSRGKQTGTTNQKALLTTQLSFTGASRQQVFHSKRAGTGIGSGNVSNAYNSSQQEVSKTTAGPNSKATETGNNKHQRSNDYLRLKRVTNALAQQQHQNHINNEQPVGGMQQKQRMNEILAEKQKPQSKGSAGGSDDLSKKSSACTTATADSGPGKQAVNAERAARYARRLHKASSQGVQPPATQSGQVDDVTVGVQKVRVGMAGEAGLNRKAGSGTRVEQKVAESHALGHALVAQKAGSSIFVTKHSFVKAHAGSKRNAAANKQPLEQLQGIILGNMKAGQVAGAGGQIRQIKDLGSNPGSRVGSHKANVRPGDQTTLIKKNQVNPGAGVAPERFVQNSIVRGAPRIGMGAPLISKAPGNGTARGQIVREGGSQGRNQPPSMAQNGAGSAGAIKASLGAAQNRPKKGSCHAIVQRVKGQIQLHGSLESKVPQQESTTQEATTTSQSKLTSRKSSKAAILIDERFDQQSQMENIPAEECREDKAHRINSILEGNATQQARGIMVAPMSSRSGDANNKLLEQDDGNQMQMVRVKGITRARNTGSVEATKHRDNSLTAKSPQAKKTEEDHELTLFQEIHKNLVAGDAKERPSPLATHNVSKEYRTKMVDWMVEVTTSFKCATRTYFLAVAIFDGYMRAVQGSKKLENTDVHLVGVGAMYLASKYEDIYPLHSKVVSEKISHGAFSQKQILEREAEYLRLFHFEMDFITPFDIHQTYVHLIRKRLNPKQDKDAGRMLSKIEELSLLLVRMAMQNSTFSTYTNTMLVYSCFQAAATMLQLSKHSDETASRFYSDFKLSFMRLANEIERSGPQSIINRDFSLTGRQQVNQLAEKLIEFYKIFDNWHCGLNQLKTFKTLSFDLSVATQNKVKQALDLATSPSKSRPSLLSTKQPTPSK